MSLPKEPRQLMINLMYLVLTAMLALNITKEVLTAFTTINTSIERSNSSITDKNLKFYETFDAAEQSADREKVKPFNDKAKMIRAASEELFGYLQSLKDSVIMQSGGVELVNGVEQVKSIDDINTPTKLFVDNGKGAELKERMHQYVNYLLERVEKPEVRNAMKTQIPLQITDLPKTDENPKGDWSRGTFNNIPVVAAIAMMSKFQNDVKNSESMVLEYLLSQVHADDYKFDALAAIAVPKTSYALEGQEIEATVMLAAYNKTAVPKISSTAGPVQVKEGVGTLKFRASGAGVKTVNGVITIEKGGAPESYPYKFEYMVGTAGASLQLDKMMVMYIGVPNPITLSASGYNIEDVSLSMPGADLKSTGKGKYEASVTKQGTIEYAINARARTGETVKVGGDKIRVKYIPAPEAVVGNYKSGRVETAKAKAQRGLIARLENFDFETKFEVIDFRFAYMPRSGAGEYGEAENKTAVFNPTLKGYMDRSRPGDKWIFENIRVKGPDGRVQTINSVTLTLN